MADRYVYSGAGGTASGADWTNAYLTISAAIVASTNADTIYVASDHSESTGAAISWGFPSSAGLRVISADRTSGTPPTTLAVGATATPGAVAAALTVTGFGYIYGVSLLGATGSSNSNDLNFATNSAPAHLVLESCLLSVRSTGAIAEIQFGSTSSTTVDDCQIDLISTALSFGSTSGSITLGSVRLNGVGLSIDAGSSTPTTLFECTNAGGSVTISASDLSGKSWSNIALAGASNGPVTLRFSQCKFPAGFSAFSSISSGVGGPEMWITDCASGDTHGLFQYHNALGSVISDTGISYTGGAAGQSWKIVTTASAKLSSPFVTPWVNWYHAGTSSITPRLEILRDGSATAYDNDEVWGEFAAKATSGSTAASFYSDRMAVLGSPAAQASGADTWDGENATHWAGKVDSGSAITPAEAGDLRARVCVGLASATVYVDPFIRT